MKISIFGLGYVGAVTAGCLTLRGHEVTGVDVHAPKVETLNRGEAPIIEPGLPELLKQARENGLLKATTDVEAAVQATDVSLVCVGTPSAITGALDLRFVRQVAAQIGDSLRASGKKHALVFRSTMLPGSTAGIVAEFLSDLVSGGQLQVFYYPEFLREGAAVEDFLKPSIVVAGTQTGDRPDAEMMELFGADAAIVNWNTAEMIKYACNAFHATKIAFANEIGRLGKELGIDSGMVMTLLCQDRKLNLSPYYMRPGNPFGGSCLPKDVRALTHFGRQNGVSLPVLENLLQSNEQHLRNLLLRIEEAGQHEVIILGLSFKSNTDDLRESAMVDVAQTLLGRGHAVRIYDPQLNLAQLVGSNKRLIDTKMPHLASLLQKDLASALGGGGLIVAAQRCASVLDLGRLVTSNHRVLDVNGWPELRQLPCKYEGFCW
ncbi:MAG TPA: nucleotide sugar dehydrogenase [Methylomirabilota bacterium]|nr:nucleotide sugar dehydrogenase [Methylomirabilota bacterium]